MTDIPQSKSEITLRHTIVYYTFLPMVTLVFISIISQIPLWLLGYISVEGALRIPWVSLLFACVYLYFLGDYVIPAETYRNIRDGKWGYGED